MKKIFYQTIFIFITILSTSCIYPQKPPPEQSKVSYEKHLRPFIIEQIDNTAETFFYDREKANRDRINKGLPVVRESPLNFKAGDKETGGVCEDYVFHFIDNYKGPGEVYFLGVDNNRKAQLPRRVKPFERSDIIISDKKTIDSFIEEIYQDVIRQTNKETKGKNAYLINEDKKERWSAFYTRTINGIIYWSKEPFDLNTTLVPFRKDHIIIHQKNYQKERDKEKEDSINNFYNSILQDKKDKKEFRNSTHFIKENRDWNIFPIRLHSKDGKIFLIDETSISTPKFHAGETIEKFSNHAWVRIHWNGMVVDVDPTWYDNGRPLEQVIEVIK